MKEIEAKIIEINESEVRKRLIELGARLEFEHEFAAVYFDHDMGIKDLGKVVRIRKEGGNAIFTYKEPAASDNPSIKVRKELEVGVSDFGSMKTILESLGFRSTLEMVKIRAQYQLDNVHVVIDRYKDEYSHIPAFMEIEAPDEESLILAAEKLGYGQKDLLSWNAAELIEHYKKPGN